MTARDSLRSRAEALLRRWPALTALAAGGLAALALPPYHVLPLLLGFALWLALLRPARSRWAIARIGFAFGYGWYLVGLYWVAIAFYTDPERFGALAVPAVLALAAVNALFPTVAALLVSLRRWRSPLAHGVVLALAWLLLEPLRDSWGTRFPWNPLAIVWAPWPVLQQPAAWVGSYGLSLLTLLVALLPATWLLEQGRQRWTGPALATGLLVLMAGVGSWRLSTVPLAEPSGLRLRIVQANIAQHHKWDPDQRVDWFNRHMELSVAPAAEPPGVIIWPESAVPWQIEREPEVRRVMAEVAPDGGYVLAGGDRFDLNGQMPVANNSLFALDSHGAVRARYDKVDLVPFGEFLPFRPVLSQLGLGKVVEGTFDFVPGPGRQTVALPGLPSFSPLICYEAIFAREATGNGPRPAWLLNITNDAWFGHSSGPYQHLAMARLRAIEEGLPLVRAANTGISVVTDAFGRIVEQLPLGVAGVIDAPLPPTTQSAPLARGAGLIIHGALLIVVFFAGILAERRASQPIG